MRRNGKDRIITGALFPPHSSAFFPAHVFCANNRLKVIQEGGDVLFDVPFDQARLDSGPGAGVKNVNLPQGYLFQTQDQNILSLLNEGHASAKLRYLERFKSHLILFAVACLIIVWAWVRYAIPFIALLAVWATPNIIIKGIDTANLKALDTIFFDPSHLKETQKKKVQTIWQDLLEHTGDYPSYFTPRLYFRDFGGEEQNAFALPAGTVVMSDALVKAYENQPSVLAGILGHELTHVNKQHGLQQVYRSLSLYVWMALITGDLGPFVEEFLSGGELLMGLVYSREHELDADAGAVHLLIKAEYDPQGLIYFFKSFDKKQNIFAAQEGHETNRQETEIFSWFSTHPSNAARITAMGKQITSQ